MTIASEPGDVRARSAIATALSSVRAAVANPQIRRVVGAWSLGIAGDWVLLVALLVVAYQAGGPLGVGVLGLARMVPATIVGTLAGVPAARFGSAHVLLAANVIRLVAAVACAAAGGMAAPVGVVFVAAGIGASVGALVRPVLLRDIPRTATVTTLEPTRVLELDAASFKAAIAGPAAWAAAEATMTRYLGESPA